MNSSSEPNTAKNFAARPPLLSAGQVLQQRYRIVRELGSGGMGAVYEAVDQRLEITVAIKETFSKDPVLRRQFEHEARLLAQLHHAALPRVSDYFAEHGRAFLVMQFISGADLAQAMSIQKGPFPRNQVIAWADQLLDVLVYLHTRDRQIIHRDIKPHNLKLTESGQLALLDFGLAKTQTDESSTDLTNSVFGYTRRYSPIEQIQDQGTSPQSDIYALGATLYHLLTGVKPLDALARASALAGNLPDPLERAHQVHKAVGPELAAILNKAMAVNAVNRFGSAKEFRETLRQLGRQETARGAKDGVSLNDPVEFDAEAINRHERFEDYSILKPEEDPFSITKSKRPAIVLALVAVLSITIAASYPSGLNGVVTSLLTWASSALPLKKSAATVTRTQRSENPSPPPTLNTTVDVASGEIIRKPSVSRRRPRHSTPKPDSLKPPPFSIAPGELGYSLP